MLVGCALAGLPFAAAQAAFSSFIPLNWGGSISYNYGYVSAATESERMQLLGTVNAGGYVWQPWFATTSAALSLGLTNTETTTSSADSNLVSGTFSFSVFPFSRFPFTLSYSRSDSRTASFSDLTQLSGSVYHQLSRLSLRQMYSARGGSLSTLWYYRSDFSGAETSSLTEAYGFSHQIQSAPNTLSLTANYSTSESSESDSRPESLVLALNHIYTPHPETGVTNLLTYLVTDSGAGVSAESSVTQGSSSFYWRPEHRSLSVSGGVRASKSESSGGSDRRSLDTNIGVNYRITRRASMRAGLTVGTAESGNSRSLTSSQSLGISYSSHRYPLGAGFDWVWTTSGTAGNSLSRMESPGRKETNSTRSLGGGLTHNVSGQWALGRAASLSTGFSQGLSASKSSAVKEVSKTVSNSFNMSSSYRGRRGTTYGGVQMSDSRSMGERAAVFQRAAVNLTQDLTLSRLSTIGGHISFDINRQESQVESGNTETGSRRYANLGLNYQNQRPFGIYNLRFRSRFGASKEIGNDIPSQRLDWDNRFQYRLGLLSMAASFRMTQSGEGVPVKSLYFQATRSF
ncbi:hypothetical protein MNBD_GAMMA20-28 [hydrothermal vent metagenome]|uniref:TIGR03016 family PEP-CTERM system-associated outer membrane protein n=1 Tax=hydrothermal vent metagenome TaxID=652676 RepID=A0A3B1A615_9ZZZZ